MAVLCKLLYNKKYYGRATNQTNSVTFGIYPLTLKSASQIFATSSQMHKVLQFKNIFLRVFWLL